MKQKIYTSPVLIFSIIFIISCQSAGKLYRQGHYHAAIEAAIKKLQKKPNDAEAISVVKSAYKYAVTEHERKIYDYARSNNHLKYEWIHSEYSSLQYLYNIIYTAPSVYELVRPINYSSYVTTYREKAGDIHVERGITWMNQRNKESFKKAYYEFQSALSFKSGDIEILKLRDKAYAAALTRILVVPADKYEFQFHSYMNRFQRSSDEIIRNLVYNSGSEFVQFYSILDVRSKNIQPDQTIELRLNNLIVGRVQENRYTREITNDVVAKEIVYKQDSIVKKYRKVKAQITTTKRTMYSSGELALTVRDDAGNYLWTHLVTANNNWLTQFTNYTGDERALSQDDKRLLNNKSDNTPNDPYVIDCIMQELYNNTINKIRNYYARY